MTNVNDKFSWKRFAARMSLPFAWILSMAIMLVMIPVVILSLPFFLIVGWIFWARGKDPEDFLLAPILLLISPWRIYGYAEDSANLTIERHDEDYY